MATVEYIHPRIDRHKELVSNRGQARRLDQTATKLEDYIRSLQSMQRLCMFIDVNDADNTLAKIIRVFTKAMSELRSDANRLRRM